MKQAAKERGREEKGGWELEKEIRTKYKKSINHSRYCLVDILDQMAKEM